MAHEIVEGLEDSIRLRDVLLLSKAVADAWHLHVMGQIDRRHVDGSICSIEKQRIRCVIVRI
jgi:hypothetical protein